MKTRLFIFLTAALYLNPCHQSLGQENRSLEEQLTAIMSKYQAIGLTIAVLQGQDIIYQRPFGVKNIVSQTPLTDSDIFRIASVSKTFVATAIMQLVESGKLALNDDVGQLIGFPLRNPRYPDTVITLAMLLSHRSSLNDQNGYFTLDAIHPDRGEGWKKAFNEYAPGTGYQYCNLNFNLAGAILEKYSGERFDRYIQRHILAPLGLHGGFYVDELDTDKLVTLYTFNRDSGTYSPSPEAYQSRKSALENYQIGYSAPVFSPTGGMKISAPDLARYMGMHMHHGEWSGVRLLTASSSRTMQTPRTAASGYGLGMRTIKDIVPGVSLIGHEGISYGLYSAMYFQPDTKFGMVIITNGCQTGFSHGDVINDFLYEVMNTLYKNLAVRQP